MNKIVPFLAIFLWIYACTPIYGQYAAQSQANKYLPAVQFTEQLPEIARDFYKINKQLYPKIDLLRKLYTDSAVTCRAMCAKGKELQHNNELLHALLIYDSLLTMYPGHQLAEGYYSQLRGNEAKLWQEVRRSRSVKNIRRYLKLLPNGAHAATAKQWLERQVFQTAREHNVRDDYRNYLHHYPHGRYAHQASRQIETYSKHWQVGVSMQLANDVFHTSSDHTRAQNLNFFRTNVLSPLAISISRPEIRLRAGLSHGAIPSFKADNRRNNGFYTISNGLSTHYSVSVYPMNFGEYHRNNLVINWYVLGELRQFNRFSVRDYFAGVSYKNSYRENLYNLNVLQVGIGIEYENYYTGGWRYFLEVTRSLSVDKKTLQQEIGEVNPLGYSNISAGVGYYLNLNQ